jgi:hypothetical protein
VTRYLGACRGAGLNDRTWSQPQLGLTSRVETSICGVCSAYTGLAMAPRSNWKGYLKLSLVSASIAILRGERGAFDRRDEGKRR